MLNRNIDSIIYQSYIKLGTLTYKLATEGEAGLVGVKEQKILWQQALLIFSVLDVIEDSIVVQNNSVYQLRGITIQEMNKLLSLLVAGAGIFDFPVAPFIPVKDVTAIIAGGPPGGIGPPGTSAYSAMVFASDTIGTGLSTTPNPSLPYVAFKTSSSPIPLVAGSFTGLWVNYVGAPGPGSTFIQDIIVSQSNGKTVGKYLHGQTIPAAGKTPEQVMRDIAIEYINSSFSAFSISGQLTTIEVGTTLSGSKTFLWTVTLGSGVVPLIDIYDNTASSTLLAGTANDGTQAVTITTIQLNSNGATESWKGIGTDTTPPVTFNSANFVVTARFMRFFGPSATTPGNSAQVRALPTNEFQVPSPNTFILNTGTTEIKFHVALPPGVTITSIFDLDALNANITAFYVLTGTISVNDAGGTPRIYNIYRMDIGTPYSSSHRHSITTS